jgi:hypothetical protein
MAKRPSLALRCSEDRKPLTHPKNTKRVAGSGSIEWKLEDGMIVICGRAIDDDLTPVDLGSARLPGWEAAGALICDMVKRHARSEAYGQITGEKKGGGQ